MHFLLDPGGEKAFGSELIDPVADRVAVFFVEVDLFGSAVFFLIRIGDGEAVVAVGRDFEDGGAPFLESAFAGFGELGKEGIDFPTVGEIPVDVVCFGTAGEVVFEGRGAAVAGAHGVFVVFQDEDGGDVEETGEVEGFVEDALVDGAVAEEAEDDAFGLLVFESEAEAEGDGSLRSGDGIAAPVPVGRAEDGEVSSFPLITASCFSHEFGDD